MKIAITALSSIAALGDDPTQIWNHYLNEQHFISEKEIGNKKTFISCIPAESVKKIIALRDANNKYKALDLTVLYAIYAARNAIKKAGWQKDNTFGINIGSSRGATTLFENYYEDFLTHGVSSALTSPTTTLGNISSWVAHDLQTEGPEFSHSITCSTALHALANGIAWIKSGMSNKFLVGGSEAPLTNFTIAQMKALKVYASEISKNNYPCRALDFNKEKNTMVLGEGAAVACLEKNPLQTPLAYIEQIGYATEVLKHNVSISKDANCLQKSMKMALKNTSPDSVDVVVMHAPGTIKGDLTEMTAIKKVFQNRIPAFTSNKWKIGHTFGASGLLSLELAVLMLQHNTFVPVPFIKKQHLRKDIKKVLVNAVGFGGNAVSVLLSRP